MSMQSSMLLVSPRRGLDKRASRLNLAVDLDIACEFCDRTDCPSLDGRTYECDTKFDWMDDLTTGERWWLEHLDELARNEAQLEDAVDHWDNWDSSRYYRGPSFDELAFSGFDFEDPYY